MNWVDAAPQTDTERDRYRMALHVLDNITAELAYGRNLSAAEVHRRYRRALLGPDADGQPEAPNPSKETQR